MPPQPSVPTLRVLLVDDDPMHAQRFSSIFADRGWSIVSAGGAMEALRLAKGESFDAAIVDLLMPVRPFGMQEAAGGTLTGLVLARRLRERRPRLPIVFLSIAPSPETTEWCQANPPAMIESKSNVRPDTAYLIESFVRSGTDGHLVELEEVLLRFPVFVAELGRRHSGRRSLRVVDEYDVQDLLRAILSLHLRDVREEEWTPSYAGGSARIDFVIPGRGVAIEVKVTRVGLKAKQLGEQLIVDIARYGRRPEVKTLVCFVVDLANAVTNAEGFRTDLEGASRPGLAVRVLVVNLAPRNKSPSRAGSA